MNTITLVELRQLAERCDETFVSLYMPGAVGVDSRQNPVRFKTLLQRAERKLADIEAADARQLLAPANELLDRSEMWEEVVHGLAVLVDRDGAKIWRLPFDCDETCVVGPHFYLLPLVKWLAEEASYYVLAVSQNSVRLFHGSRSGIEEVAAPGLPPNLHAALRYDDPEPALQSHSARPQVPGKESMAFHGQGGAADAKKQEISAFFREIDRALADQLQQQTDPLIYAGVEYEFSIYQQVNTYPHLLPTAIAGNPELWSLPELTQRAWPLAKAVIDERRRGELAKCWDLVAHDRTSNRLEDILVAGQAVAVETLFIDPSVRQFGTFSPETSTVHLDDAAGNDAEELINLAAVLVLRSSGWVETLESGNIPGGGALAAVLRYVFTPATSSSTTTKSASGASKSPPRT